MSILFSPRYMNICQVHSITAVDVVLSDIDLSDAAHMSTVR